MKGQKISLGRLNKLNVNGVTLQDVDLKDHCTFKTGGKAKYYLEVATLEGLIKVINYLYSSDFPYFILGNGSNILVSDKGYDGVVIRLVGDFLRCNFVSDGLLECGGGVMLAKACSVASAESYSGLECSAGIPATVGGAVYMNAGAYGYLTGDIVDYVVAIVRGRITYFRNADCKFSYRHSVFMENQGVILRVGFRLKKGDRAEIEKKYQEIWETRKKALPYESPSAGCVFKKPDGLEIGKKLDELGIKGLTLGDAKVSEKHANFIINAGSALSQDIYYLIGIIQKRFENNMGFSLEPEIIFLGEFDENTW